MKPKPTPVIPFDTESEAGTLACVLQAEDVAAQYLDQLNETDFHDLRHLTIFRTLVKLQFDNQPLNPIALTLQLKSDGAIEEAGGNDYVLTLPDAAPSVANFQSFLQTVKDRAARRNMIAEAEDMTRRARDLRAPVELTLSETILDRLTARQFDSLKVIEEPNPRYSIAGNGICTPGNITTISAGVKSAKTSFILAMLASPMATPEADCLGVSSSNPDGLAVLHFDTEQSVFDHHAGITRSARRAGITTPPPWLRSYCVTGFSLRDLRASLPALLKQSKEKYGGVHSVLLDGAADYVPDVNDPVECNAFIAEIHAYAIAYECPIIGVIHFNPGTEKSRGHLGSQMERKAETNLRLDRDGDCICLWSEKNRRAPITKNNGPRFQWSNDQSMFVSVAPAGETKAEIKRAELTTLRDEAYRLTGKHSLHWSDLVAAIKRVPGVGSEKTAIRRVTEMTSMGIILKNLIGQYEHPTPK